MNTNKTETAEARTGNNAAIPQLKLSRKKQKALDAYVKYCKTIDVHAEASEYYRNWKEFKLKPETIGSESEKIERIGTLQLVSSDTERHLIVLNDLINQGVVTVRPVSESIPAFS